MNEYAAGASAARNKVASYLREHGVDVRPSRYGRPPTDDDFLKAMLDATEASAVRPDPTSVVVFEWWNRMWFFPVPTNAIRDVEQRVRDSYPLFDTEDEKWGRSRFYLAADVDGVIEVHQEKLWRKDEYAIKPREATVFDVAGSERKNS